VKERHDEKDIRSYAKMSLWNADYMTTLRLAKSVSQCDATPNYIISSRERTNRFKKR